jgi:hypothetical protein
MTRAQGASKVCCDAPDAKYRHYLELVLATLLATHSVTNWSKEGYAGQAPTTPDVGEQASQM